MQQQNRPNFRNNNRKPRYSDRPSRPAGGTAPRSFKTAEAPEGSENWVRPWVQLKYFTYNPAVFPRMLGAVSPDAEPGCLINVYDKNGELFGGGFWNPRSRTPLRMLCHGSELLTEARLEEALRRAVTWRREDCKLDATTTAYRIIHGDSDGLGGLIADRYADVLSLEVTTLGVWQRLNTWLPLLHKLCDTKRHVISVDESIARMEGIDPATAPESEPVHRVRIVENGVNFEVDFAQGHKTGFFCDQRDNRRKLSRLVEGKTMLDLCCYSGGFSIHAKLHGKAKEVTAVDLDEKAILMAKRNANINAAGGPLRIDFVHADAFVYARQMVRNGKQFDVVLLDPPKFVLGRDEEKEEGLKKYNDLNMLGLQCVRRGGLFVTCSCSGLLSPSEFEKTVIKAAQRLGRRLQILEMTGPGWDHPFLSTYPEGRYLKVLWARVIE
ncbi:MAG: class I SAM-dependent rRNA methyltransferase [Akkermansia sp.]|nr:class I SAM-dependent rRNA methyltransferase [Akkermansia sp.]